jgi:integrase/recombinase XerD
MTDAADKGSSSSGKPPKHRCCDVSCLKPEAWSPAYREALAHARRAGKPSAPAGPATAWRPATLQMRIHGLGLRLAWEEKVGLLTPDAQPGDGTTPDTVDDWIDYLLVSGNRPATIATRLDQLYSMLRVLAPKKNTWSFILPARDYFQAQVESSATKLERYVHPADLDQLGHDLRCRARTDDRMSFRWAAITYRDGVMVSMLAAGVFRLGCFSSIEIGQHLTRHGDEYWLDFEKAETKGKRPSGKPLPADLTPEIDLYLEIYRRHLLARAERFGHDTATSRFWLSEDGTPLTDKGVYQCICFRTKMRFGFVVNPHLFRHCARTAWAIDDPATSQGGKALLDHGSFKTGAEWYELGMNLTAAEQVQRVLIARRDGGARSGADSADSDGGDGPVF